MPSGLSVLKYVGAFSAISRALKNHSTILEVFLHSKYQTVLITNIHVLNANKNTNLVVVKKDNYKFYAKFWARPTGFSIACLGEVYF